jgi:hypothetical protein
VNPDNGKEVRIAGSLGLLCLMPAFVCANVDEDNFINFGRNEVSRKLIEYTESRNMTVVPVCGKLEEELAQLEPGEAEIFLEELGVKESGLNRVIHTGYQLLDYITFFTAGPMESRAWTVAAGTPAPRAASKIHTDMERGFIRMEVVSYAEMTTAGGWNQAKAAGKLRIEGKDYTVKDGDVVYIRFSV